MNKRDPVRGVKPDEKTFRLVVDGAPNAMIMAGEDGGIVLVNVQAEKLFGYRREELLGRPLELLVPERLRAAHAEHRRGFFPAHQTRAMGAGRDLYGLSKDGREIPIEIGLNPIETQDGIFILASIVDLTERRKAEELTRETARIEAERQDMETFSYTVAHEFRAPLRHIDSFIQILEKNLGGGLDAENKDLLARISGGAQKMGVLIDELLAFSKVARAELRKTAVSLDSILNEALQDFRDSRESRVEWKLGELPRAECDPAMLKLVFSNLISNALKFSRGKNPAIIEIGRANGGPNEVVVFVRDNGAGFDMRYGDKLFGVFQRLHRQEDFEGTGIGLATVSRIIARHNGAAWAESAEGRGATFYFSLPLEREETAGTRKPGA